MSGLLTRDAIIQFILGFLIGKLIGTLVSAAPVIGLYFGDPSLGGYVMDEFIFYLLSFNVYHYALAIITGLIMVIWRSSELFE